MNITKKIYVIGACMLLSLNYSCVNSKVLPGGWREPTMAEIKDSWRSESAEKFLVVEGDFNGDGIVDEAKLLVRENGSTIGVFVFISQDNYHMFKRYMLDELEGSIFIHAMGIKKVTPGLYKTACGKGYWECSKDEMPELNLKYDAIDYFKVESANSYFYWDAQTRSFKRTWISD